MFQPPATGVPPADPAPASPLFSGADPAGDVAALAALGEQPPADAWRAALQALCTAQGGAWPGGDELLQRIQAPAMPAAAWMRQAHALHTERLRNQTAAPVWFVALHQALAHAWADTPPPQRLAHGLFGAWLRGWAERGELAPLHAALAQHADAFAAGEQPGAAVVLLRQLRRLQDVAGTQRLVDLLHQAGLVQAPSPERPPVPGVADMRAEIAGAVASVARSAETPAELIWAHGWLRRLLPQLPTEAGAPSDSVNAADAPPQHWPLVRDLAVTALCTLDLPALRELAERLCGGPSLSPTCVPVLVDVLGRLAQFDARQGSDELLARASTLLPQHPVLALERAKRAQLEGVEEAALVPLFEGLDPAQPGYAQACGWLAGQLTHAGEEALALEFYRRIEAQGPLSSINQLRVAQLTARHDPTTESVPESPMFDEDLAPMLLAALQPLVQLLTASPYHGEGPTRADWARRCAEAVQAFREALTALPPPGLGEALAAQRQLSLLERSYAGAAQWVQAFPFELGPAYGRADPVRYSVLQATLCHALVALADHVLDSQRPLQGHARLRQLMDLARLRCEAWLQLDDPAAARAGLDRLAERLPGMAQAPLDLMRERCALAEGDLPAAAALRARLRFGTEAELWPMRCWADWLAAQGVAAEPRIDAPAQQGEFSSVQGDGRVLHFPHATLATSISMAALQNLQVRNSHLLIAPEGGILLPESWHLSMGEFPYEHLQVLNRGRRGATLRPASSVRRIDERVWVLANQDATYHRNFYHWMVLLLPRMHWLHAQGLLAQRRLLMPAELSGWMQASLDLIGLPRERLLPYADGECLQLADAQVLSPLEYSCAPLMDGLRERLWQAAGLDPAQPPAPHRLLYISRQSAHRRPLVNEELILAEARVRGFELLAPETLPLDQQVRLFAEARAIAGPPGAAFTNLAWCQPGTRVLSIFKEEVNLPTFVDISVQRGQQHRWLLGHNLAGFDRARIVNAPFTVSLDLARRELDWAAAA